MQEAVGSIPATPTILYPVEHHFFIEIVAGFWYDGILKQDTQKQQELSMSKKLKIIKKQIKRLNQQFDMGDLQFEIGDLPAMDMQYQFLRHGSWDVVAPKNLSEEEIGKTISDLEPVVEKAMRMGPVRRKLHSLRNSFGRWVYDQKNKHRYNAALKRGEISSALTAEATEQLRAAVDNAISTQGLSPTDDGREM